MCIKQLYKSMYIYRLLSFIKDINNNNLFNFIKIELIITNNYINNLYLIHIKKF